MLTDFNGIQITYDEIGNPTAIGEAALSWNGRQLQRVVDSGNTYSYAYNIDGQRVSKTVTQTNNTTTTTEFFYNGSTLAGQKTGDDTLVFMYDNNGDAFGFTYNGTQYYYLKNMQGDVDAVVDSNRQIVAKYAYDAWGKVVSVTDADGVDIWDYTHIGHINPIRYRSYYYDQESNFYYLNSRYYAPDICRFLNADAVISGSGESIQGYNVFVYGFNNPVNTIDKSGNWPQWIKDVANTVTNVVKTIVTAITNGISSLSSSHGANRRPNSGDPGSTYHAPNGDTRTYGPDGKPKHDYDHDDHGHPNNHPHDDKGGHNHDWNNGVRGPAYSINLDALIGVAAVTVCVIGIIYVVANDSTGVGVADDFLLIPLVNGVGRGLIHILA